MSTSALTRPVPVGRLRRLRVHELAAEGAAALLDHPEHLLQLRVGVRHPRVRRQGDADRPQDRRQPGASGQPRPHLREGRRHAEPARGSRSHPVSAEARRASAASGEWRARDVGRGARRHRRAASARRSSRTGATRSCITSAGPARTATPTACCRRGALDGHNSHTNVCSSSARLGHFLWTGNDRPSPDYANAQTILLLSSHLETGHYFNPHAQRIIEGQASGATLIVIDPRLSNTSAKADMWLPAYSGTEGALLLAMVRVLLEEDLYDREFVRRVGGLADYLARRAAGSRRHVRQLHRRAEGAVRAVHAGVRGGRDRRARGPDRRRPRARSAAPAAGSARTTGASAAAGNLWGWQITRCLYLLVVLTGSVATRGGVNLHLSNKFVPKHPSPPAPPDVLERAALPEGVSARVLRDELPAAASPQGEARQARRLLHARLQPAVDQPRRLLVDGDAAGRGRRSACTSR